MVNRLASVRWLAAGCVLLGIDLLPARSDDKPAAELPRQFAWQASPPLVSAKPVDGDEKYALKDPSVVYHEKRWHVFCTVRGQKRSHGIVYLNFTDWERAEQATQTMLPIHSGFFCAPQVFFFRPHKKWYLICQASDKAWLVGEGEHISPATASRNCYCTSACAARIVLLDFASCKGYHVTDIAKQTKTARSRSSRCTILALAVARYPIGRRSAPSAGDRVPFADTIRQRRGDGSD